MDNQAFTGHMKFTKMATAETIRDRVAALPLPIVVFVLALMGIMKFFG